MAMMALAFLVARRIGNFSIVDVMWSFNFTPIAAMFAVLGTGDPVRRMAVGAMVALWSLRLAAHLARRIAALHPVEEGRYLELRRQWKDDLNGRFFRFFLLQGALNAGLSLPFLFACLNSAPGPGLFEVAGAIVFAGSLVGEALADRQLERFRRDPGNRGKVCRAGLWGYSRHPNYFFEWLVWCAFALVASGAPYGWVSWVCPALMLYFLLRVTGIPATEEQAVRSRGEEYREYQRSTSAFVPWFRRPATRNTVTIK
jgi:steroid 5-alpha reductase family enzyme